MALGDLFYVELELANTTGARLSNIALVDRLPAGWEIENPRLGRSDATPEWVDDETLWQADHMDLRDDRIEVFGHLEDKEQRKVIYAVRAVTAGSFELPPAEAEAMYEPRHWARARGGTAVVRGPWEPAEPGEDAGEERGEEDGSPAGGDAEPDGEGGNE